MNTLFNNYYSELVLDARQFLFLSVFFTGPFQNLLVFAFHSEFVT